MKVRVSLPEIFQPLEEKSRYKILYGGRGSGKSHAFVIKLILEAVNRRMTIICAREVQKSIRQSSYKLIVRKIREMGLDRYFEILEKEIRVYNGGTINFEGLGLGQVDSIKSYDGIDLVWVEEAQNVSQKSWEELIPTVRDEGSEIWVSFNPRSDQDPTYRFFIINTPPNTIKIKVNYYDNPFFTEELEAERVHCYEKNRDRYDNIWLGECLSAGDMQFITSDAVRDAMDRDAVFLPDEALVCGVDLARGGGDPCMITFRQGLDAKSHKTYKIGSETSRDSMRVVSLLGNIFSEHRPDIINVDSGSMGGAIGDRLIQLGWKANLISFGGSALNKRLYADRASEMWDLMRMWLHNGGAIKNDERLLFELTNREFEHDRTDRLKLQSKKTMSFSPDHADSLCLTFAVKTGRVNRNNRLHRRPKKKNSNNPLDNI